MEDNQDLRKFTELCCRHLEQLLREFGLSSDLDVISSIDWQSMITLRLFSNRTRAHGAAGPMWSSCDIQHRVEIPLLLIYTIDQFTRAVGEKLRDSAETLLRYRPEIGCRIQALMASIEAKENCGITA